jgi:predicted nucleic acid-binding protein
MLVALDTNVLVYAEGLNGKPMQQAAQAIVSRLVPDATLLPVQVLGELYAVLAKRQPRAKARDTVLEWSDTFPIIETSSSMQLMGMELSVSHRLPPWDAIILAAAADAGCRVLLSEDFQDGFTWSGVTIANPFATDRHPLLASLLGDPEP